MTKHKPATPLPWASVKREVFTTADNTSAHIHVSVVGETSGFEEFSKSSQDAAYIVHACNAYPQFVAEIKAWLPPDESEDGTQDQAMRALLRELGELTEKG